MCIQYIMIPTFNQGCIRMLWSVENRKSDNIGKIISSDEHWRVAAGYPLISWLDTGGNTGAHPATNIGTYIDQLG